MNDGDDYNQRKANERRIDEERKTRQHRDSMDRAFERWRHGGPFEDPYTGDDR